MPDIKSSAYKEWNEPFEKEGDRLEKQRLDAPSGRDSLEERPLVDFEFLLLERDKVKQRLTAVEQIDPESTDKGDDTDSSVRLLARWYKEDITGRTSFEANVETAEEKTEVVAKIQEKFNKILDRIRERVEAECSSLGNLNAINETVKLLATAEENKKELQMVQALTFQSDTSKASYSAARGKIFINKENLRLETSPSALVQALAEEGFSKSAKSLHHEQIHSKQFPPKSVRVQRAKKIARYAVWSTLAGLSVAEFGAPGAGGAILVTLLRPYIAKWILDNMKRFDSTKSKVIATETQAYWGSERFAGEEDQQTERGVEHRRMFSSLAEYMEHISKYGVMREKSDVDKLVVALIEIRRLYALGMTDSEVARLVEKSKWKKEKLEYDLLEQEVKVRMQDRGLDEGDLDTLVEAENIKSRIYIDKVKVIAREQLRKAYSEEKQLAQARWDLRKKVS